MNKKEEINLNRFRKIIEKRKFDEYDIIAFLITIRPHLKRKQTPLICDFADNIAHKKRNQGNAFDSAMNAEQSNYILDKFGKVKNYKGIIDSNWGIEWSIISKLFNIKITPVIISEITLCIFSIVQFTKFEYDKKQIREYPEYKKFKTFFGLLIDKNSSLSLITSGSQSVCYGKLYDIELEEKFKNIFFFDPVETIRINKKLYLKCKDQKILYVRRKK